MHHFEGENTKKNSGEDAQLPPQTTPPLGGGYPSPDLIPVGAFSASTQVPKALESSPDHISSYEPAVYNTMDQSAVCVP